jgi:hypothetical protein
MELEGSQPLSQDPSTFLDSEPDEFSWHFAVEFLEDLF